MVGVVDEVGTGVPGVVSSLLLLLSIITFFGPVSALWGVLSFCFLGLLFDDDPLGCSSFSLFRILIFYSLQF